MNINDPQQSIDGWELIEPIGYGGNAKVWKARRPGTELVALKILNATNPTGEPYQRFVAEVTVGQGEANNPSVLPLIDYSLPDAPNKHMRAWLAMPIAERIDHAFADYRSLEKVVEAISSIAATLAELAERDIYHRDIKPQNLYRYEGRWVIGDFGLVDYPDKQSLTVSDKPVGSRYFIAQK